MTYVLSDIHGNYRRFRSILEQIDLGLRTPFMSWGM